MDHTVLQSFLTVAECGSFSKAAERLFISSTAVMKQINGLEEEIGVKLFARTNRGLTLTEAGQSFGKDAAVILEHISQAITQARQLASSREPVRIGNSLLNPCKPLLDLWNALSERPDCTIRIVPFVDTVETPDRVYHTLGRDFDVLIGACDIADYSEFLQILNIGTYKLCIGAPQRHPLAGRKRLTLGDLTGERLIMLREGVSGILDSVRRMLRTEYPSITIEDSPKYYDLDVFNRCEQEGALLLTLDAWKDVHPALCTIPVELDFVIPCGILYPLRPAPQVKRFLDAVRNALH